MNWCHHGFRYRLITCSLPDLTPMGTLGTNFIGSVKFASKSIHFNSGKMWLKISSTKWRLFFGLQYILFYINFFKLYHYNKNVRSLPCAHPWWCYISLQHRRNPVHIRCPGYSFSTKMKINFKVQLFWFYTVTIVFKSTPSWTPVRSTLPTHITLNSTFCVENIGKYW